MKAVVRKKRAKMTMNHQHSKNSRELYLDGQDIINHYYNLILL